MSSRSRSAGELDLAFGPAAAVLSGRPHGRGELQLVVDLGGVTFCDSTALGVFVGAHRRVAASDGQIEFHEPPPSLRNLLVVSGLDQILTVAERLIAPGLGRGPLR